MPPDTAGGEPDRGHRLRIYPNDAGPGWLASIWDGKDYAKNAEQARALAAAWIRAAEVLENVKPVVDAEDAEMIADAEPPDDDFQCLGCGKRTTVDTPTGWRCTECGASDDAR